MALKSRKELVNTAHSHLKLKNYSLAENILKRALVSFPNDYELIELLIVSYERNNKPNEAIQLIESIIQDERCSYENLYKYASYLFSIKDFDGAISLIKKIIDRFGESFTILYDLGLSQASNEQFDDALNSFLSAEKLNPNSAETFYNIGLIFDKKNNQNQALAYYKRSIKLSPDLLYAWINLGIIYCDQKLFQESKKAFDSALCLDSNSRDAWFNLGILYKNFNELDFAFRCLNKSLEIDKYFANAYATKGDIFLALKNYSESSINYKNAFDINPEHPFIQGLYHHTKMQMCDWIDFESTTNQIRIGIQSKKPVSPPFPLIGSFDDLHLQLLASEIWSSTHYFVNSNFIYSKNEAGKIKVAYFSSDFYNHATMHLFFDVLKFHNKKDFIIYGFNFSPIKDHISEAVSKNLDFLFDVSDLSDQSVAELAIKEKIDIAVDLKGYTENARPKIFSYGVAPIQINFLGHPGSLGNKSYTHIIADDIVIPPELESNYTESVCRLPNCYQPNPDKRSFLFNKQIDLTRSDLGLPDDIFVFCSFNANYKITPQIFSSWVSILKSVPKSVFWCLTQSDAAKLNLLSSFQKFNIDPIRIIFCEPIDRRTHINRLRHADLFLDTYPCSGHTTASDSLIAGLPILTIQGSTFASRVCSSLLNAIGCPSLVARNFAEYENIAIDLSTNLDTYSLFRKNFIKSVQNSELFDASLYAIRLENIYHELANKKTTPEGGFKL
jgi:protein O-GlcNAc transferase